MGRRGVKKKLGEVLKTGRPIAPPNLDATAKRAWSTLCDDLEEQGTLVKTDRKLIELYAKTYALLSRVEQQLADEPLTFGSDERKFINPLINQYNNLAGKLRTILNDCGLSPSTRKKQPLGGDLEAFGNGDT